MAGADMLKLALQGRSGRMGQTLVGLIKASDDLILLDDISKAQVVIDFSSAAGLLKLLQTAVEHGTAVVSGSTGLQTSHFQALKQAATHIPLLWAANMSPGMNLLYQLASDAASHLGVDADVEISESHHRDKRDVPSGSALTIAGDIAASRGQSLDDVMVQRTAGTDGARQSGEIGISSMRGGSMPGEHTVLFALKHESLVLAHRVENRSVFAHGAISAARWLVDKPPGRYAYHDLLMQSRTA